MEKIRIKCPSCGAILEVADNPANVNKFATCPNCKQRNRFVDFLRIMPKTTPVATQSDETYMTTSTKGSVGYLIDKITGIKYTLKLGLQLIGRKTSKIPQAADIMIETTDRGMSREHLYIDVVRGTDGHFHVYAFNAKNQNATEINGTILADGDKVGLKNGDILRLCSTPLQYVGYLSDDETVLR